MRGNRRGITGRRLMPVWFIVIMHVLALGVVLNAFALADGALRPEVTARRLPTEAPKPTAAGNPAKPAASPSSTAPGGTAPAGTATAQASATKDPHPGMWGAKFPGKFTSGEVKKTDTTYQSRDVSIFIEKHKENGVVYFVADICIRNLENFGAAFVKDRLGTAERTEKQAENRHAILAINGDNSGYRKNRVGYEVRGGAEYLASEYRDVLIMYNDGILKTFSRQEFDYETEMSSGKLWHVWCFGPMLLDQNGNSMEKYDDCGDISGQRNPRTAIGYYEPGHYCFVVVDGRQPGYSDPGMTLQQLSKLMYGLGCKVAYNFDGGQTSEMVFSGNVVNRPYDGGRITSDILYICEAN